MCRVEFDSARYPTQSKDLSLGLGQTCAIFYRTQMKPINSRKMIWLDWVNIGFNIEKSIFKVLKSYNFFMDWVIGLPNL